MTKLSVLILLILLVFWGTLEADTIYLKNERVLEGMIKSEDEKSIELEMGFGTLRIAKDELSKIDKSTPEEAKAIYQKWERQKIASEDRAQRARMRQEIEPKRVKVPEKNIQIIQERPREKAKPREVELSQESGHIVVDALLNNKVRASLLLDTGSSLVVLSNNIGKALGVDTDVEDKEGILPLTLADGSSIDTKYVRLESVIVEGAEVKDVDAAVLLDEATDTGFSDGLLGLSFLNAFNFTIDQENNKLILEEFER